MLCPLKRAVELAIKEEQEKRKFPALSMISQILCGFFYHLFGLSSLRAAVEKMNNCQDPKLGTVALSTVSDAMNSKRRLNVLRQVFQNLLLEFSTQVSPRLHNFRNIAALDSTIIHCVPKALWAKFRKAVKACKAHLLFDLAKGIPKSFVLSAAKIHDRKFFELFLQKGWTYVVDRAYNVYSLFDDMIDLRIFFITRLKSNASYQVVKRKHVKRRHRKMGVISDEIIRLGAGVTEMVNNLRLVIFRAEDGEILHFLTNRFDLTPTSIAALYKARWSIELFFKFFKRTLRGARLLARSEVGAEIHVLLALMVDLLLKCLAKVIGCWDRVKRHVPAVFMRLVREFLFRFWSMRLQVLLSKAFP
jgi:putative transposase